MSILHLAVTSGSLETCRLLLDHLAKVDVGDGFDRTALSIAAAHGLTEICCLLLDRGANIESMDSAQRRPLHKACVSGGTETFLFLLERGAEVRARNGDGVTALQRAKAVDHDIACLALIAYGADPTEGPLEMRHLTPIEAAARGGFIPRLMALLGGCDVDYQKLSDFALEHGRQESAACIRSYVAAVQLRSIANRREMGLNGQ